MAVAKAFPDPAKGGRGKNLKVAEGFSQASLSNARTVLRLAPDLVDLILAGSMTVEVAYNRQKREEARKAKASAFVCEECPPMREAA